ncbi:uncharacterized protein LOC128554766 [Mercenaria mercenaria]|uniref:uncharacterized protein LOC128554766 n=1 Tax=Mercenaria mercenaria TaxID=6596 RepID=UPI00234F6AC3|nr:uncharacterized protein LOC128554766 [Mercenaria mercenaria]
MANRPWGTPWGQFKQGIRFSQPLNDPLSIIGRFFSLKSSAKRALAKNDLGLALECYTKALEILLIHPQQHLPAQIANEHHLILCNRSLVHYKQGLYKQAEDDALAAIEICPRHLKSYWRACQAIIARSRDKQQDAMSYLVKGLSLTFQGEGNRRDQIDFLTELCKIAIEAPRTDKMVSMLCSLQLPDTRDKVWLSVLKNLMDQNKWESMAMILIHYDPRGVRHSLNTLDVTQWHCSDINIGKLLSALSDDEMQRWGEQLAVCLLQKGAIVDTIGEHYMTNALHFVVKLSLRIGSVRLLRHVLENYKDDPEMMNSKDEHGNTAIHIVAKSEVNEDFCEAVLTLLLKNNCDASIQNKNDKKPIDFISKQSKLFSLLKQNSVSVQELRETLEAFKTEGNKAKKSKEYTKALQMYDEALDVAQQSPELYKEAAILYSNKSNVLHQMNEFEGALANAIAAVNSDPEYSKGYYRNGKALLCLGSAKDAFITFIDGCLKSKDDADTITLLIEATTIIDNLSSNDIKTCYEMLFKVETSIWPSVLTQLSKKAEWKSIAYLILGSNLDACRCCELFTADCIDQFCSGVAGKISTADIETWTIFKYLNQHDGKDIVHWLDAVLFAVYSHGGEQTLKNFAVNGRDCPLHAVARFVLQTGRTSLLEVFPRQSSSWSDMSTAGESVFHLLANYKPPVPADFLVKVTKTLLEKGYRNIVKTDRNNMLPYDCLDIKYPLCVFDLFLPNNMCDVSLKAQKLNYIGFLKHRNGEYSDSIVLFSKALEVYPQKDPSVVMCIYVYTVAIKHISLQHTYVISNRIFIKHSKTF